MDSTLFNLAVLIMEKPINTRIHTFDFRDDFLEITIKIGRLDKLFRENIYPNTKNYIMYNHIKLLDSFDELIKLFFMIFFDKKKTQLNKDIIAGLKELIVNNITDYINGLDVIFKPYYLTYPQQFIHLKEYIDYMNEIFEELKKDLSGLDKINFADFDSEYIDGILPNTLFVKNYNKIDPKFQSQYMIHNRKLIEIIEDFSQKYKTFKELFTKHIIKYTDEEEEFIKQQRIVFEEENIINDFTNINSCQDLFISVVSEVIDLYAIGRMLKPYVKTSVYYAGLTHTKNIIKKLQEYSFELKYESNSINRTTWENIGEYENYCIDIKQISI